MITLNIFCLMSIGIPEFIVFVAIIAVVFIVVKNIKNRREEDDITISPDQINKVVNVNLIGGIIGIFSSSPQNRLNDAISDENADGWKVIQVIPADNGNIFLIIIRLLLLFITLFLYTTVNGYYLIMEKKSDSENKSE